MKVKKFTCHQCGAPKVNSFKGMYVVCDYCSTMMDIDTTATFEMLNPTGENLLSWEALQLKHNFKIPQYVDKEDKQGLKNFLVNYCKKYYTIFPDSLPPNVPRGKKYQKYVEDIAEFTTQIYLSRELHKAKGKYEYLAKSIGYYQNNGQNYADYKHFIKMIEAYDLYLDLEMKLMFGGGFPIFAEYTSEAIMRKMKLSHIAQSWVPVLETENANTFLNKYQLTHEFVEIQTPLIDVMNCQGCKKEIQVPKGSLKFICNHCRHEHIFRSTVNCHNCAMENNIPENWSSKIDCSGCGTELRVVQPLFV